MLSSVFINEGGDTTGGSDEVLFIAETASELLSVCMAFSLMLSLTTTSKEVTVEVAFILENKITEHLYVGRYRGTLDSTPGPKQRMGVSVFCIPYVILEQDKKRVYLKF